MNSVVETPLAQVPGGYSPAGIVSHGWESRQSCQCNTTRLVDFPHSRNGGLPVCGCSIAANRSQSSQADFAAGRGM